MCQRALTHVAMCVGCVSEGLSSYSHQERKQCDLAMVISVILGSFEHIMVLLLIVMLFVGSCHMLGTSSQHSFSGGACEVVLGEVQEGQTDPGTYETFTLTQSHPS